MKTHINADIPPQWLEEIEIEGIFEDVDTSYIEHELRMAFLDAKHLYGFKQACRMMAEIITKERDRG